MPELNKQKLITVLTPIYNRKDTLSILYHSLQAQTSKAEFTWFIADDGSEDGTQEMVYDWQEKAANVFTIRYCKYENGGKHRAINRALQEIDTELTFIVDSDDALTMDAILTVVQAYSLAAKENKLKELCGFSFQRRRPDGSLMCRKVPQEGLRSTYCEERINKKNTGDIAEVWVTDILRKYPFPEFENEKFLGEDTVWIRMSGPYKMCFYNQAIYISEYLDDGLTNNRRKHNIHSPNGCCERARTFLAARDIRGSHKIKPAIQYIIYGRIAGKNLSVLWKGCPVGARKYFCLTFLPACVLERKWRGLQ